MVSELEIEDISDVKELLEEPSGNNILLKSDPFGPDEYEFLEPYLQGRTVIADLNASRAEHVEEALSNLEALYTIESANMATGVVDDGYHGYVSNPSDVTGKGMRMLDAVKDAVQKGEETRNIALIIERPNISFQYMGGTDEASKSVNRFIDHTASMVRKMGGTGIYIEDPELCYGEGSAALRTNMDAIYAMD